MEVTASLIDTIRMDDPMLACWRGGGEKTFGDGAGGREDLVALGSVSCLLVTKDGGGDISSRSSCLPVTEASALDKRSSNPDRPFNSFGLNILAILALKGENGAACVAGRWCDGFWSALKASSAFRFLDASLLSETSGARDMALVGGILIMFNTEDDSELPGIGSSRAALGTEDPGRWRASCNC
jgi:hypothetical protein